MQKGYIFYTIRSLVKTIPKGKVSTYGLVARAIGIDPRVVGWALRGNLDKSIPCHRVVQKGGTLSPGFSLNGWQEQCHRLSADGLHFSGRQIKNFRHHLFNFEVK